MAVDYIQTALGTFEIQATPKGVQAVQHVDFPSKTISANKHTVSCKQQLQQYLAGKCNTFTVPLDVTGTPFQKKVWHTAAATAAGSTMTYQDLAVAIQKPKACRAVGTALRHNPVLILVPCHRILPKHGRSVGQFAAGVQRKQWLLAHEKSACSH